MTLFVDARVPVRFGGIEDAPPDAALLVEGEAPAPERLMPVLRFAASGDAGPSAAPACLCCVPRGAVASALGRLFLARARGEVEFFRSVTAVVSTADGEGAVRAAVERDPLVSGCYRIEDEVTERIAS